MDAFIYTAMSGADHAQRSLGVRANNLANAHTAGFRADTAVSETTTVKGYGYDSRHQARLAESAVVHAPGQLSETGRSLDVAIQGEGYFVLDTDSGSAYTRAGSLQMDADGALTSNGHKVRGEGGPIVLPPHSQVSIGNDGSISVLPQGQTELQVVDKLLLVKPDPADLLKNEQGHLITRSGMDYPADDSVAVAPGHVEGSNVSAVEEMMQTMQLTRSFEMQMRMFKVADEMAEGGNRLMRS
ncbi:flagellar basal-body rod protein FlgF [Dyella sp. M7H15-1]|uniref:flagellar basal-body rod protein FlgF n=1 Tax=Dyella sp. M7H15-1 TaxID=2501295 RepID=UPI0010051D57|nr:flagellar basal-body rod protein FlgF [Dyella sp. M7H15-1]QAU23975.1 flagellar basal-body rod protein FlgF [Dyella sp. M7H15-1]